MAHDERVRTIERDGFTARQGTLDDAPGILRVIEAAFDSWPAMPIDVSPLEHLQWKLAPPGGEGGHHTVVTVEGNVVAVKLRWIGPIWVRGARYLGDSGADLAVDPAFQGRGLGRMLVVFEETGERPYGSLGYDPPSQNEVARTLSQSGKTPLPLRIWTRPLDLRSQIATQRRAEGVLGAVRAVASAAAGRLHRTGGDEEVVVARLDRFDERIDALWLAAREAFDFVRVRDAEYLNWRFADRRSGRSTILEASVAGELIGYVVLRPDPGDVINVGDLLVHPQRPEALAPLLRESIARARDAGASRLIAWLPDGHPYEPALADAGFVPARETVDNQFFEPRGFEGESIIGVLADPALRAHITMGDFDFV